MHPKSVLSAEIEPGRAKPPRLAPAVVWFVLGSGHIGILAISAGCATEPNAATFQTDRESDPVQFKPELDAADRHRVNDTFRDLAAGHQAVDPPAPAAGGKRWSDVLDAAATACESIEATITYAAERDGAWLFTLRTVEDLPGRMTVKRVNDARVYEAAASIGLYDDRTERAAALLRSFDEQMLVFGRRRKLEP